MPRPAPKGQVYTLALSTQDPDVTGVLAVAIDGRTIDGMCLIAEVERLPAAPGPNGGRARRRYRVTMCCPGCGVAHNDMPRKVLRNLDDAHDWAFEAARKMAGAIGAAMQTAHPDDAVAAAASGGVVGEA